MKQAASKARAGKILVVEDNIDSRDLLAKLLGMSGYEVLSAPDGESALATALKQVPDLIITDINMPRMDGIALLRKVRLESVLDRTSVFVVTAFGSEAAREAMEAGADAATAKPFDFEPGTARLYSNANYILLGAIVEKVTGKPFHDAMAETVLGWRPQRRATSARETGWCARTTFMTMRRFRSRAVSLVAARRLRRSSLRI